MTIPLHVPVDQTAQIIDCNHYSFDFGLLLTNTSSTINTVADAGQFFGTLNAFPIKPEANTGSTDSGAPSGKEVPSNQGDTQTSAEATAPRVEENPNQQKGNFSSPITQDNPTVEEDSGPATANEAPAPGSEEAYNQFETQTQQTDKNVDNLKERIQARRKQSENARPKSRVFFAPMIRGLSF